MASLISETPDVASVTTLSPLEAEGPAKDIFQSVVLGSMCDEPLLEPDATIVQCTECTRDVDITVAQKVGSGRIGRKTNALYKCNECNALQSRMSRMFAKRASLASDWSLLSADQKKDFIART